MGDPIANFVGYDFDNLYTRVVLVGFLDTVFEVAKVCCDPSSIPIQPVVTRKGKEKNIRHTTLTNVS